MNSIFRRRKVLCFYCGQHTIPDDSAEYHPNGRVSCFFCPHCSADNHLDEKGEIVDYVPETPPKPTTFAHRTGNSSRFTRPSALHGLGLDGGPSSAPPSPTFCTRCEHNQLIIQSAKNQYDMPPEDHPDYQHHAAVLYPQYVQDFEKRYPPVCSECGPRVRQKLKEANYQAKVASLGHMLVRSERPGVPVKFGPLEGLKWIVWMVRGAVWAWANVLFLVWNLCAALYAPYTSESMVTETPGWTECVLNSIEKSELDPTCYQVSHQQFSKYFPWSLLGFWWLYRQWGMDRHPEKKLVGGREYLNIEVAVVLIRLAAWILLGENGYIQTANKDTLMQFHAGFFFVSFVAFLFSITCLKLEDPPSFSLRETNLPINSRLASPERPPARPPARSSPPPVLLPTPRRQPLALNKTPPLRPLYSSQQIPPITPSYRDSGIEYSPSPTPKRQRDENEMDWDPISPIPLNNKGNPWAIRERSVSPIRNRGLHSSNPGRLSLSSSTSLNPSEIRFGVPQTPSSIFGTRTPASTDPIKNNPPPMAEMKFRRIASPTHDDTGLEGIFDGGLRIVDEPEIVTRGDGVRQEREALIEVLGRIGLLVVAGGVVGFAPTGFKVLALPAVVTAALWRMVRTNDASRVLSGVEILATIATGFVSALGVAEERVLENVGIGIVAGATVMEVWRLLLRMQRQRKRVFWKEERKRALEDEKKARRTAAREEGSTSPVYGLNSFGFRTASPAPAPLGASMSLGNSRRGRGF